MDLGYAKDELQSVKPLQGNLDPALLVAGGEAMKRGAVVILEKLGPKHIFNLGHGVVPETPPEHVAELVKFVHDWKV
jgi:uroporphyrinogen decarboxylase